MKKFCFEDTFFEGVCVEDDEQGDCLVLEEGGCWKTCKYGGASEEMKRVKEVASATVHGWLVFDGYEIMNNVDPKGRIILYKTEAKARHDFRRDVDYIFIQCITDDSDKIYEE